MGWRRRRIFRNDAADRITPDWEGQGWGEGGFAEWGEGGFAEIS